MASKNQLSKGGITQYARDFIEALKLGDQLAEFSQRFSNETASTRRDVLEAVCERRLHVLRRLCHRVPGECQA